MSHNDELCGSDELIRLLLYFKTLHKSELFLWFCKKDGCPQLEVSPDSPPTPKLLELTIVALSEFVPSPKDFNIIPLENLVILVMFLTLDLLSSFVWDVFISYCSSVYL